MTRLVQDLRYGCRTLRKSPISSIVAALTLALGIGANSAIFTVINAALLAPLPFPAPERLALVWEDTSMFGLRDSPVALGNYTDWHGQNHVFERMGALEERSFRLTGIGEAQQVFGAVVTASLPETLGVKPALGRLFHEDDDRPGAPKTAILSDGLWHSAFGGDRAVVGRSVEINDEKYEVIGIMPPRFRFPNNTSDVWAPVGTAYGPDELVKRGRHNWMVVGRLKPGVTVARANEELRVIALRAQRDYPETNDGVGAFVAPLREHFVSDLRPALEVLGGAVAFVLLIACANIANLLLARASNRAREIAIRAAVGASRWQVARQLLPSARWRVSAFRTDNLACVTNDGAELAVSSAVPAFVPGPRRSPFSQEHLRVLLRRTPCVA
jgi:putative ABC transport system permease protein